jgi:hypothetical protein
MTIMTYRQALHDTLRAEMTRDERVFLMGEEIGVFEGSYKITAGLLKEFGEKRVRDTPIAEEGFAGAAIGAAMLGLRPVIEMMTINFSRWTRSSTTRPRSTACSAASPACRWSSAPRAAAGSSSALPTRRTSSCSTPSCPA